MGNGAVKKASQFSWHESCKMPRTLVRSVRIGCACLILVSILASKAHAQYGPTASIIFSGTEQTPGGIPDAGSVTLTINGYTKTVQYGQFSSKEGIASAFGGTISLDPASPVLARADGNVLTIITKYWHEGFLSSVAGSVNGSSFSLQVTPPQRLTPSFDVSCDPAQTPATSSCLAIMPSGVTGRITYTLDGTPWLISAPLEIVNYRESRATAQGSTAGASVGTHQVIATYPGDFNFLPTSDTFQMFVSGDPQMPTVFGQPIYSYSFPQDGFDGNGNIHAYNDSINGNWTAGYDNLNRLSTASMGYGNKLEYTCWKYDVFGNRLAQEISQEVCTPEAISTVVTAPSNQLAIPGFIYDAGGNLQADATNFYLYDGEGRMCATKKVIAGTLVMEAYLYDADGERVGKGTTSSFSCDRTLNGFVLSKESWGDIEGHVVDSGPSLQLSSQIYANGNLLATLDAQGLRFEHRDWLGTLRTETDQLGESIKLYQSRSFGDETSGENSFNEGSDTNRFTGKERDYESGLDYSIYRMYESTLGRWMSPDPGWFLAVHKNDPQTWNMYAYVVNNPLRYADPFGLSKDCGGGGDPSVVCLVTRLWDWLTKGSTTGGNGSTGPGGGGASGVIPNASDYFLRINYDTGANSSNIREAQYQLYSHKTNQPVTQKNHRSSDLFIFETQSAKMGGLDKVGDFFANTHENTEPFTFTDQVGGRCFLFCDTIDSTQHFYLQTKSSGFDPSARYPLSVENGGKSYSSLSIRIKQMGLFTPGSVLIQGMSRWPGVPSAPPKEP